MTFKNLHKTHESKRLAALRLLVALVFGGAGLAKLVLPQLADAFRGQLIAAEIPYYQYLAFLVPLLEIILGYSLLIGKNTRVWASISIVIMSVAVYVHVVVQDPSLFPLQPVQPIIPVVLIVLSAGLVYFGAGTWSKDLDIFEK